MNIKELIDNHKYISFDIFDTLIKRNINRPIDIFKLIEIVYKNKYDKEINYFHDKRIYCESNARKLSEKEDITLDEIYKQLCEYYTENELLKIKDIEIECELSICKRNEDILEIFDYAKKKNKYIIIASDMYLDKKTIEDILAENNINGYNKLFLSSEIKKTKYKGSMYEIILNELDCKPNEVLHIGDNLISDVKRPASFGIKTYYIKGSNEGRFIKKISNRILNTKNKNVTEEELTDNVIDNFIKNNCSKLSEHYMYGYKYFGLLIYGFMQWIDECCEKNGVERLYFFSRDGYILNQAYDEFFKARYKIESSYLFVSRRSLIVPSIEKGTSCKQLINILGIRRKDTIKTFFRKIGLKEEDYLESIQKCELELNQLINYESNKEKIDKLYNMIQEDMLSNCYIEKSNLIKYLKQEHLFDYKKVAIVDIGWRGSLQYSLNKILKTENIDTHITGLYLGLNNKSIEYSEKGMESFGYAFKPSDNKLESSFIGCLGVIETFFSAPHGSVIGYSDDNNGNDKVSCILDNYEYNSLDMNLINDIQKGAIDFIKDFSIFNNKLSIKISSKQASRRIINILTNPTYKYVTELGNINFSDYGVNYIAKPRSKQYYIKNPKNLYKDFANSTWKIGFMKRFFRIKLPYLKIYCIMRKNSE